MWYITRAYQGIDRANLLVLGNECGEGAEKEQGERPGPVVIGVGDLHSASNYVFNGLKVTSSREGQSYDLSILADRLHNAEADVVEEFHQLQRILLSLERLSQSKENEIGECREWALLDVGAVRGDHAQHIRQ